MRLPAKLALLTSLYLAQGLPYGFFTQALPVVMRKEGVSLIAIGASSVLALPWGLKFLWAPLVDRHAGSPLGPRRGWIVPLQLVSVVLAALLAGLRGLDGASLAVVMAVAVLAMNLVAATQDIATDGLAVDLLSDKERGVGNGVQVAAYRVGMILGGGVLVGVFDAAGWQPTFLSMAAVLAAASVPILLVREPARAGGAAERATLGAAVAFLRRDGVAPWLALVAVYKLGDALMGPTARIMLVDGGYTLAEIGALFGTWGSAFGLAGAMAGGVLAQRLGRRAALVTAGLAHAALVALYAWPAFVGVGGADASSTRDVVAALVVLEHLTGGMATVALFTSMMDICHPRAGATEYTVQASVVVGAQFLGSVLSGVSAQGLGYGRHFVLVAGVCVLGVAVMATWFHRRPASGADPLTSPDR